MIDTGSWNTSDLMTYLVRHRQSLPAMEFANLRRRRVFPMEQAPGAHPYKTVLSELYEPLDVFRQLKLPILDWGENRWQPHTEEARMLVELGLKTHPDLQTIMNIMVDSDENIRKQGLVFFLNNFDARYASGYRIGNVRHLAFIPAIKSNGDHFMAKPDDVYADPECAVMGFPVVEPQFCDVAELKLRVSKHPPVTAIMKVLLGTPPTTPEIAQGYFEYLAMRVADFSTKDLDVLRDASIIPTSSQKDDSNSGEDVTWVMVKPRECILETEAKTTLSNLHSKIFVSIDFGSKGNIFLKACGVKDQPDIEDIVPIILQDPKKFLNVVGGPKGYQEQLRQIAAYKNFPPRLMSQMRSSPFLFGQRRSMRPTSQSPSDVKDKNESQYDLLFDLLKPNEIAIVDDTNSYLLFASSLYVAPQEDLLETFYSNLGSPRLTTLIKDSCDADHIEFSETDMASKVRNLVLERLPLLLLEPNMQARVSPAWLAVNDNFQVRVYQKLRLKRILSFHRHISIRSQDVTANAVLATWCGQIRLILLLKMGCEPDMYEMANSVCKALLINSRPKDSLLFTTMLSTDLEALRRRGYDVDRILNQQKLKIAEEIRQAEIARQKSQKPDSQSPSPAPNPSKPSKALENIWRNAMSTRGKSYCDVRGSEEYTEPKRACPTPVIVWILISSHRSGFWLPVVRITR
ncbi:hypothetical protein FRC02_005284 [Tulasnella sp. 418]|nr:hypothetical protein FRC02_005284 [Tulasnella sp. 418]